MTVLLFPSSNGTADEKEKAVEKELAQSLDDVHLKTSPAEKTPTAKPRNPPKDSELEEDETTLD